MGNPVSVTRPEGNRRTMAYDLLNRLIQVTDDPDGLGLVTRYAYDANDNMTDQYDPKDNHTAFTYDALSRKTSHIQHKAAGNLTTSYTAYDAEGNLTQMTDPNGYTFTYAYDALNRQTQADYPTTGSPYLETTRIATAYDPNNNVTQVTETKTGGVTDVTVNTYDNFDRLDDTTQRGKFVDYTYDLNGNRTGVASPGGSTTYTFDDRNRLSTAVTASQTTTYTYYPDGKKDTIAYPNGTSVKHIYDAADRVQNITHSSGGSAFASYAYTYDHNGNRLTQTETQNSATETTTYTYDTVDRLKPIPLPAPVSSRPNTPTTATIAKPKPSPPTARSPNPAPIPTTRPIG